MYALLSFYGLYSLCLKFGDMRVGNVRLWRHSQKDSPYPVSIPYHFGAVPNLNRLKYSAGLWKVQAADNHSSSCLGCQRLQPLYVSILKTFEFAWNNVFSNRGGPWRPGNRPFGNRPFMRGRGRPRFFHNNYKPRDDRYRRYERDMSRSDDDDASPMRKVTPPFICYKNKITCIHLSFIKLVITLVSLIFPCWPSLIEQFK